MTRTDLYGVWTCLLQNQPVEIVAENLDSTKLNDYRIGLQNLITDNVEQPLMQTKVTVTFRDYKKSVRLTLPDLMVNLCMWGFVLEAGHTLKPWHLFFCKKGIDKKAIANYINKYAIIPNRETMDPKRLNEMIYNNHKTLKFAEKFALFYNNSINHEDFILMANACPEFDELMHKDYSNLPADQMNAEAMKDCNRIIELILESKKWIGRDHCLADAFRAKVGVKPKQFREMISNIGIKPNGEGGIFPHSIDASYMRGGLNRFEWMVAEAGIGRQAQILSKQNTADSGAFARVLGLNQIDTNLYTDEFGNVDPDYDCHTKNFVEVTLTEENIEMYQDRYFRLHPDGMEYNTGCLNTLRHDLVGKTIYLRSPITCASAARGQGICRKCYGNLFMGNRIVNIGKIAAELISQTLTQLMLSAKHLLEAKISKIEWSIPQEQFDQFFTFDDEDIYVNSEFLGGKKWLIHIDRDSVDTETVVSMSDSDSDGDDFDILRDYITQFEIITPEGEVIEIHGTNNECLYLQDEFCKLINSKQYEDETDIFIPITDLQQSRIPVFGVGIYNDDLGKNLKEVMSIINLKTKTCNYTRHEILRDFINKLIDCGMGGIRSVHAEIIIMNQIRAVDDILLKPDWDYPDQEYRILTLRQALEANPSIQVTMQYENLARTLYKPISFRKTAPSKLDMFAHVQPQVYMAEKVESEVQTKPLFEIIEKPEDLNN